MRTKLTFVVAGVAALVVVTPRPAPAHHAFSAEFDADRPIHLEGTVKKMEWINPHAWVHVEVATPGGTVETWMIEGGLNTLLRRGFTKKSLLPGTKIVVDGYQAKDREGSFVLDLESRARRAPPSVRPPILALVSRSLVHPLLNR